MSGQAHCLHFPKCMELGLPPECSREDCPTKVNRETFARLLAHTQDDTAAFKDRIAEVLAKYGIGLPDAPVTALAEAMQRMVENRQKNLVSPTGSD